MFLLTLRVNIWDFLFFSWEKYVCRNAKCLNPYKHTNEIIFCNRKLVLNIIGYFRQRFVLFLASQPNQRLPPRELQPLREREQPSQEQQPLRRRPARPGSQALRRQHARMGRQPRLRLHRHSRQPRLRLHRHSGRHRFRQSAGLLEKWRENMD